MLKLPLRIPDSNRGELNDRYLLHHYFEIFADGDTRYSSLYTEEIVTGAGVCRWHCRAVESLTTEVNLLNDERDTLDVMTETAPASNECEYRVEGRVSGLMKQRVVRRPTIGWQILGQGTSERRVIAYRGDLAKDSSRGLRVHYGFDGWQEPIHEVRLESIEPGVAVAELPELNGTDRNRHIALDCSDHRW